MVKSLSLSLSKSAASLPVVPVPVVVVPVGGVTAVVGSGSESGVTPGVSLLSVPDIDIYREKVEISNYYYDTFIPVEVVHSPGVGP